MRLGKYQLIRKLATGGMAEVFLAKTAGPMGFEKTLVIKRILPHLAEDQQFVQMFLTEATLAAQLNHPNLVQIFDFGEAEGSFYLAMEYINGPNLRLLLHRAKETAVAIPLALGARIASAAAEGLAYAHDFEDPETGRPLHLVHRDVSPDNILISRSGSVKVVDFGIAKARGQTHQTQTGTIKGKVAYMAAEQLRGEPLDRRVDLYALGVILYELFTGTMPFEANSDASLVRAVLYDPYIPAAARRPELPLVLQQILARLLAKNREERYASCRELHADLERFIHGTGESASGFQLSQLVARLAPPASPVTPIRSIELPPAPTASAYATTEPILLTQPHPPVPLEVQTNRARRSSGGTGRRNAEDGFAFHVSLESERGPAAAGESLPLQRTDVQPITGATDVRRRVAGGGAGRWAALAVLVLAGAAGLIAWRTQRPAALWEAVARPRDVTPSAAPAVADPVPAAAPRGTEPAARTAENAPQTPGAPVASAPPPTAGTEERTGAGLTPGAPATRGPAVADARPDSARAPVPASDPSAARPSASRPSTAPTPGAPAPTPPAPAAHGTRRDGAGGVNTKLLGAFAAAEAAAPKDATLRIETLPSVQVRWKGQVLGTTPLTFTLPDPGGEADLELFDPRAGLSHVEHVSLGPGDNGAHPYVFPRGKIAFALEPGTVVTIDGKKAGQAPLDPVPVFAGKHQIALELEGQTEQRLVSVEPDAEETLEFSFEH